MRNLLRCSTVALAFVNVASYGQQPPASGAMQAMKPGPMQMVGIVSCPAGFTASPSTYNPKQPYNQSYTCTGPVMHCMTGFNLDKQALGYGPPPSGGMIGTPIYGSGIVLDSAGRIAFTCRQPQPPPK